MGHKEHLLKDSNRGGGVLGAPVDPLAKERTGESWSPRTFHRQRGERAASSPWP